MAGCNNVQVIASTECIGDSLTKINNNFANLDTALCEVINSSSPALMSIRLSYSPITSTPTSDLKNATTLYIHPYRGTAVTFWNTVTNSWNLYKLNTILSFSLGGLAADTNYDIYMYPSGATFAVDFVAWPSSGAGSSLPTRVYQDGVAVRPGAINKRLVGCLRTTSIAGQSEQSFGENIAGGATPKQFLWNAQNIIPVTCYSFEVGTYTAVGGTNGWTGWRRVNPLSTNNGRNNRFSFIVGDNTLVTMTSQVYASYYANVNQIVTYTGIGINTEASPTVGQGSQIISELRGSDMTPRAQLMKSFTGSYNYLQMFENLYTGPGKTVLMNENHQNQTGFLVSLYN
jgi:hypothetical protein